MNTDLNSTNRNECISKTHNCHNKETSKYQIFINIIEKISAVALGAFSLYTSWQLFVPFFSVGLCIGIYSYITDEKSCNGSNQVSSCTHGLLEGLTGVKLPPLISIVANIAVAVCHIDHHATVFVPIIGVSLGNWIGKTTSHYGVLAYRKITGNLSSEPVLAS